MDCIATRSSSETHQTPLADGAVRIPHNDGFGSDSPPYEESSSNTQQVGAASSKALHDAPAGDDHHRRGIESEWNTDQDPGAAAAVRISPQPAPRVHGMTMAVRSRAGWPRTVAA